MANTLSFSKKVQIAAHLAEGVGIRSTARLVDCHRDTVMRFGVRVGEAATELHDHLVRDLNCTILECDEAWTFVLKKQHRLNGGDPEEAGSQFCHLAFDPNSKLIVSFLVEKRSNAAVTELLKDVRRRVLGSPMICTDGHFPYPAAIEEAFGCDAHHAVLIKEFQGEGEGKTEHRHAPAKLRFLQKIAVSGDPDLNLASTSLIERLNLDLRGNTRRYTRLVLGFSKKLENLRAATALWVFHHNWIKVHSTIRVTPAMEAGLAASPWSIRDLLVIGLGEDENGAQEAA